MYEPMRLASARSICAATSELRGAEGKVHKEAVAARQAYVTDPPAQTDTVPAVVCFVSGLKK